MRRTPSLVVHACVVVPSDEKRNSYALPDSAAFPPSVSAKKCLPVAGTRIVPRWSPRSSFFWKATRVPPAAHAPATENVREAPRREAAARHGEVGHGTSRVGAIVRAACVDAKTDEARVGEARTALHGAAEDHTRCPAGTRTHTQASDCA